MVLLSLAYRSLRNRKLTSALTLGSIDPSVALLIGVEQVRLGARESFANTISQTDLIVGARGGALQLLLYTVFRIGSATNNIAYESYQRFRTHPAVHGPFPIRCVTATTASESSAPAKNSISTTVTGATGESRWRRGVYRPRSSMWRWAPMWPPS
jgi:hypothetical protein